MKLKNIVFLNVVLCLIFLTIANSSPVFAEENNTELKYKTNYKDYGWNDFVSNGTVSESEDNNSNLIVISFEVTGDEEVSLQICVNTSDGNWSEYYDASQEVLVSEDDYIQAYKVKLVGADADKYSVYYTSYLSQVGWLAWAKNNQVSGSVGFGYSINAINIIIQKSTDEEPANLGDIGFSSYQDKLYYSAYVQKAGWKKEVSDMENAGTQGKSLRLEAFRARVKNNSIDGGIEYCSHVEKIGWFDTYSSNNAMTGTVGKARRMEAIKVRLTGDLKNAYDIYYRLHVQSVGWLDWAVNGQMSGTSGYSRRAEGLEMSLRIKGTGKPDTTDGLSYTQLTKKVKYMAYVQKKGWLNKVSSGKSAGTTGQNLRMEAMKIYLSGDGPSGDILCSTHVANKGWLSYKSSGNVAGTTGEGLGIQAIKLKLTGELSRTFDIYYRVHVEGVGWLSWAKNAQIAGTVGFSKSIQAVQIKLVIKGAEAPSNSGCKYNYRALMDTVKYQTITNGFLKGFKAYITNGVGPTGGIYYRSYIENTGWEGTFTGNNMTTGNGSQNIQAIQIKLGGNLQNVYDVYYRTHVEKYGWLGWTKNGGNAGTIGYNCNIDNIQMMLKIKGSKAPGSLSNACLVYTRPVTGLGSDIDSMSYAIVDSTGNRLDTAFNWSVMNYKKYDVNPELGVGYFARYGLTNHYGNCYVMAATFTALARALGYNARQMTGYVPSARGGLVPHSWAEVLINGTYYVFDPDLQEETGYSGFMFQYGKSGTWRYTMYSVMHN